MTRYQIMYWNDIPAQVKAEDDEGNVVKAMLPDRSVYISPGSLADLVGIQRLLVL